jgi:signal transduction histidine kinase
MKKILFTFCIIITQVILVKAQTIVNIPKEGIVYIGKEMLSSVDKNNDIRIEDILSNESAITFEQTDKYSIGSNGSCKLWLKFTVNNSTGQRAFIDFNPSLADSIVLYTLDDKKELHIAQTGLAFKYSERGIQHFSQNIELFGKKDTPQTYYARLVTKVPVNFFVSIGTEQAFWHCYSKQNTAWGLFLGVVLFVIFIGLYVYFFVKLNKYIFFMLYLISMVGSMAIYNGKIHEILFYNTPQYNSFSILLRFLPQITTVLFTLSFLKIKKLLPNHFRIMQIILVFYVANLFYALFNTEIAILMLQTTGVPILVYSIYLSIRAYFLGHKTAMYYTIGWCLHPIGLILYNLANLGWIPAHFHSIVFSYIAIILQAVLITIAFTRLLQLLSNKKEEAQALFIKVLNEKQDNINKHNDELKRVVDELKKEFDMSLMREKIKEEKLIKNNRELQEFASIVSHDLRAPLRNINSFAQILVRRNKDKFDDKDQEYVQFILSGVKQSSQLIEDLLNYSRMDKNIGKPETLDLNDIVLQILNNNNNYLGERNVSMNIDVMPTIKAHTSLIVLIWQNLILNGVKYNESENPTIEVGWKKQNEEDIFFVKDNGIGIPPQYQEEIFRMFRRLHTSDQYEGTGIGLAFCKRVIEFYEGNIWFESVKDEGTTFFFTLPKVALDAHQNEIYKMKNADEIEVAA